jgi:4a-hydroxytetrahydrobiopterin dehydratase
MSRAMCEPDVRRALQGLSDWQYEPPALRRAFRFPDFAAAMRFAGRVEQIARAMNHHPKLQIS